MVLSGMFRTWNRAGFINFLGPSSAKICLFFRKLGSVTAPQLMRLVNDLDKDVYRVQFPVTSARTFDSQTVRQATDGAASSSLEFGDLARRVTNPKPDNCDGCDAAEEEPLKDHHLRLSRTGRAHEPSWYLGKIHRLCKEGDTHAAVELFFHKMLTVDRVMPDRNIVHVLIDGLADVGDSESAFKVYRKMTELGIFATNSTYSRLFRACTEDIAAWQREHRYVFNLPNTSGRVYLQSDLELFAGPALLRAKGLWVKLHERGFRMNKITYNTLLQALAKAGDLHACFQALDMMLLGRGGLPPSVLRFSTTSLPPACSAEPLPPFRPDEYTLTAVLTAIQQSFKSGALTSPLDALHLALHAWHLIIPRLPSRRPSLHHFTLLAGIVGLESPKNSKFSLPTFLGSGTGRQKVEKSMNDFLEVIPESLPKLREPQCSPCPRIIASEKAAKNLLKRMVLLASTAGASTHPPNIPTSSDLIPSTGAITSVSCSPLTNEISLDWCDSNIVLRSPVNLLLPLPEEGVRIKMPPKQALPQGQRSIPPWQRLALLGGIEGFLECITTNFGLSHSPTSPLITKVAALLPPPSGNTSAKLDQWESALLNALKTNKIVLDLPILNNLLKRRATYGLSVEKLMAIANRQGLSPDEFTWSCLARGCRTTKQIRDFLTSYSKSAKPADLLQPMRAGIVRPSLYIYSSLLASTKFCWDSKIIILRSMMGASQLTSKSKQRIYDHNKVPVGAEDPQPRDSPILPNRRLIANLELEIANFRDLIARGIVPKDGSSVGACEKTGGVIIPPYSLKAFKKFLPVYKEWAEQTVISDAPSASK